MTRHEDIRKKLEETADALVKDAHEDPENKIHYSIAVTLLGIMTELSAIHALLENKL